MTTVRFTVPVKPAGANQLYRRSRVGPRKTDVAIQFTNAIASYGARARRAAGAPTLTGPVEVALRIVFADERPDLDGPVKTILDALQPMRAHRHPAHRRVGCGVIANDRQVRRLIVERETDKHAPRVEIAVTEIAP